MKILYHHRTLGDGAEGIHIREMVQAFRLLGHDVIVVGPTGEPLDGHRNKTNSFGWLKAALPPVTFELLEVAYSFFCFISLCLKIIKIKPDFIYDRYITFNAGAIWAGHWYRIPVVLEVNAPLALERSTEPDERLHFKKLAIFLERYVCSHANLTIVVSTPLRKHLESIGVPVGKCLVLPNGVNQHAFVPKKKDLNLMRTLGIAVDATVIGFAGILRPWHGLEMIVDAVAQLKSAGKHIYLLIVGDGPIRLQLEDAFREAGVTENAQITGRISHDAVANYMNLFDIAVSSKATFYASPMKIVEYMALGKAVVAPDSQNFRDLVDNGINGVLFSNDRTNSFKEILSSLCDSESLRNQLGNQAREKVEKRLNWEWNAREICSRVINRG